jgi:hypothetical protein
VPYLICFRFCGEERVCGLLADWVVHILQLVQQILLLHHQAAPLLNPVFWIRL